MISTRADFETGLTAFMNTLERPLSFWWRDDDAIDNTPALQTMLGLQARHDVPLGLAVIPEGVKPPLVEAIGTNGLVTVLQHGWQHINHAPKSEKKQELGLHRPLETVLRELEEGKTRLRERFGEQFQPVLTPPWNRIAPEVADGAAARVGLMGLSTYNKAPDNKPYQCNTHVDIINWRDSRGFIGWQALFDLMVQEMTERKDTGSDEPIGFLSHHLVHDDGCWEALDAVFTVLAPHTKASFPAIPALFKL